MVNKHNISTAGSQAHCSFVSLLLGFENNLSHKNDTKYVATTKLQQLRHRLKCFESRNNRTTSLSEFVQFKNELKEKAQMLLGWPTVLPHTIADDLCKSLGAID